MVGPASSAKPSRIFRPSWVCRNVGPVGSRRHRSQDGGYTSTRPADAELRAELRDLANARRRFGYRRLFVLLRQRDERSGKNRIYRLYREEGLTVRKRRARRRAVGTRAPIVVEAKPNALSGARRAEMQRLHLPHPLPKQVLDRRWRCSSKSTPPSLRPELNSSATAVHRRDRGSAAAPFSSWLKPIAISLLSGVSR
jgi:hypothetical protein